MPLDAELLRESFALVTERDPDLTLHFYETLFARHPRLEPLFRRDREVQAKMLAEALAAVLDHLEDAPWLDATLRHMGEQHVGYGVTPDMYGPVGESLLATLADAAGDAWDPQLEAAWKEAYGAISGLMLAGAAERE